MPVLTITPQLRTTDLDRSICFYTTMFAAVAVLAGCENVGGASPAFCEITSPNDPAPETVQRIHRGQRKSEVDAILGAPDYSPTEGQYYHSTGGDCELVDADRRAPCGYVLEYRGKRFDLAKGMTDQDRLESCSWGAIGE